MTVLEIGRRVLFLTQDASTIERQLAGIDIDMSEAGPLRDDISTDEITPMRVLTMYDSRLGNVPYVGLKCSGRFPVQAGAVKSGRFGVTVAGKRYGKGSSREHSPLAELHAGVRLVIAESFERIYRQNADSIGLFTATDFGLIERIQRADPIEIEELIASRDALAAKILSAGGLIPYGRRYLQSTCLIAPKQQACAARHPMTLVEKIIQRHRVSDAQASLPQLPGRGIFVRPDWRFIHEYYTGLCSQLLADSLGGDACLYEPQTILCFEDHLSYAHRSPMHIEAGLTPELLELTRAHRRFVQSHGLKNHGHRADSEGSEGIAHPLLTERYALPGQVIVGTDSHTPHSGCIGSLSFGVGTTEVASSMLTGAVRLTVPETLRIELQGPIAPGVTAKDIALYLLAEPAIKTGLGIGKVFEFCGTALAKLSTDERATLTNMTAELGGLTGIIAPDQETIRFLRERRNIEFRLEPWMQSDPDAHYLSQITVDCASLSPYVAQPGDPGNGVPLASITNRPRLDIAYGGSCTGGKREDFDQYYRVLSWAHQRTLRVAPRVKLYLQFGTGAVRDYCEARGYVDIFKAVGAELLEPACGACANCGPGASTSPDQVTVSAINRNFPGRSGPGQVWLGSPATVAASAISGVLCSFEELRQEAASMRIAAPGSCAQVNDWTSL